MFVKALNHIIQEIGGRIASKKPDEKDSDIINYAVGIQLQSLAHLHGVFFLLNEFVESIKREKKQEIKPLMTEVCKLFAITQIQRLAEPIIEAGFICPMKWSLLGAEKEAAMKAMRPHIAVLLDSFGIPDKYLRSEVVRGDPYENFLNRARECEINTSVTNSALEVRKISEVLAAKPRL